jgi:hypothetical protein
MKPSFNAQTVRLTVHYCEKFEFADWHRRRIDKPSAAERLLKHFGGGGAVAVEH